MEIGKYYIFYEGDIPHVGYYIGAIKLEREAIHMFSMPEGGYKFSNAIHDEINTMNTSALFIRQILHRLDGTHAEVSHDNYEFKIVIRRDIANIRLDDIEEAMDDVLENFWSVQWQELRENSISVRHYEIIATFRIHDVHEAEMRFNDLRNN